MLKQLIIENLILVDEAHIDFTLGLNIITGETGSGKSALIEALSLCMGKRADTALIRQNAKSATIEAHFDLASDSPVWKILEEAAIPASPDELLSIKRQITNEGKNKAFINHRLASLPLLQELSLHLLEIVGQSAHHELRSLDEQLSLLDRYAEHEKHRIELEMAYQDYQIAKSLYEQLEEEERGKERESDLIAYQLQEIEEAGIKEGEEETLFEELKKLESAEEILQKTASILGHLSETPQSITLQLSKVRHLLVSLQGKTGSYTEVLALIDEAGIALNEAIHQITREASDVSLNPKRLEVVSDRIDLIHKIQKKYGPTFFDLMRYKKSLQEKKEAFTRLDERKEIAKAALEEKKHNVEALSQALSSSRKKKAKDLSQELTSMLLMLNMPSAEFLVQFEEKPLSKTGIDSCQFLLRANKGESFAFVKDQISGGELCRLLFSIKSCLSTKNRSPTIIFDEIDANVGGMTASVMGEKLTELSKERQVLCITHFPQVAKFADHHLAVFKEEKEGRTYTSIETLLNEKITKELQRMKGEALLR